MKKHYILLKITIPKDTDPKHKHWLKIHQDAHDVLKEHPVADFVELSQNVWLIPRNNEGMRFIAECTATANRCDLDVFLRFLVEDV